MLTAAEIEEWEMVVKEPPLSFAWEEIAVGLRDRVVKAEQQRDDLREALRSLLDAVAPEDVNKPSAVYARDILAKVEGKNNAKD